MRYEIIKNGESIGIKWKIEEVIECIGICKAHYYRIKKDNKITYKGDLYKINDKKFGSYN